MEGRRLSESELWCLYSIDSTLAEWLMGAQEVHICPLNPICLSFYDFVAQGFSAWALLTSRVGFLVVEDAALGITGPYSQVSCLCGLRCHL